MSQVLLESTFLWVWEPFDPKCELLFAHTAAYLGLGTAILVARRNRLDELFKLTAVTARETAGRQPGD